MASMERDRSLDLFRGFTILGMVIVNYLADVCWVPAILKHAPDVGITVADFIAPFFVLSMGLTMGASFRRRIAADGTRKTYAHFIRRSLALIGIGAILSAGEQLTGKSSAVFSWGVLQALGSASLLTLAVIRLKPFPRILVALAVFALYQTALSLGAKDIVLHSEHGGLIGCVSWAAMLMLSTAIADLAESAGKSSRAAILYPAIGLILVAAGSALGFAFPISKNRVSPAYALVTAGTGFVLLWMFRILVKRGFRFVPLEWWGENPLALYVGHLMLLGFFALPDLPAWHATAPAWLVCLQLGTIAAILTLTAGLLSKKDIRLTL
jgi:predicted acyltransferase